MTDLDLRPGVTMLPEGVVERVPLHDGDCLVVTGSAILPFEVPVADIDLFLLTTDEHLPAWEPHRDSERLSEQHECGYLLAYLAETDPEIDVEIWTHERVQQMVRAFGTGIPSTLEVESDFYKFAGVTRKVGLDLFHSIYRGAAVAGDEVLDAARDAIDWERYLAWNRIFHTVNAAHGFKGTGKSLDADHPREALMKLHWAADSVLDAAIFATGHSMNRWKWRLRYLDLVDPGVADWFGRARFPERPLGAAEIRAFVEEGRGLLSLVEASQQPNHITGKKGIEPWSS